jgi:uncharacterized repeat protein (TIGR01451 family)
MDFAADDGVLDDSGHGTNVSGVVVGVAPKSQIISLDVFDGSSANSTDILSAFNWVIANRDLYNITAINLSLGDGNSYSSYCNSVFTNPFLTPITNARSAGILTVVSAGNEGYTNGIAMPACTPGAISVGAVYDSNVGSITYSGCSDTSTAANQVTCFSNSASYLSLFAPGSLITAAGTTYAGTSQAAPHVSGLIALLSGAHPDDTVDEIETRVLTTGDPVTDSRNGVTVPQINAFNSVTIQTADLELAGVSNPNPVTVGNQLVYSFTIRNNGPETASTPTLSVTLSPGASFVSAPAVCSEAAGEVTCSLSDLLLDAVETISITTNVIASGSLVSTASVNSSTPDIVSENDSLSLTTTALDSADLSISLLASLDTALLGEGIVYEVEVVNNGPSRASSVVVTDLLPTSVNMISISQECTESSGTVTCLLGDILSGSTGSVQINVIANSAGNISNTVAVSSDTPDPDGNNNSASLSTEVLYPMVDDSAEVPFLPAWAFILLSGTLITIIWKENR